MRSKEGLLRGQARGSNPACSLRVVSTYYSFQPSTLLTAASIRPHFFKINRQDRRYTHSLRLLPPLIRPSLSASTKSSSALLRFTSPHLSSRGTFHITSCVKNAPGNKCRVVSHFWSIFRESLHLHLGHRRLKADSPAVAAVYVISDSNKLTTTVPVK